MDRHLPPAAARRFHAGGRGADSCLSGRARRQPRVPVAVPAGRSRAACMATMSTDPTRISDDLGGEAAWAGFVEAARVRNLRILLDYRAESHVRLGAQSLVGRCACTRPFSEFADYFDIRRRRCEPFCVHVCTLAHAYGESLEKGELVIESADGRPRVMHFDNSWPLAPASWGALLDDPEPCFAELIELQSAIAPGDAERARHRRAVRARRGGPRRGCRVGTACRGNRAHPRGSGAAGRDSAAAILHASRLEARGRAHQLPAILRRRAASSASGPSSRRCSRRRTCASSG